VKELVCPHLLVAVNGRTPFTAAHHHQVWARYNAIEVWIKVKKIMVASPMFGVHSSTLQCSMFSKTTSRKRGKMGVLSFKEEEEEEEEELVLQTLDAPYFQSIVIEVGRGYTKLRDAIQGENSWSGMVRWLWNRHMDLSLRVVQGLEIGCAKGLCKDEVRNFYDNLELVYWLHQYPPSQIWNMEKQCSSPKLGMGVPLCLQRREQGKCIPLP
jgi:hypothetical protein